METEGLETVHTSLGGNAVVLEGGSFLEPPSIAKVPGEEIFRKQIDQVPCLAEKNENQEQKDEGFDTTGEEETKEIAVVDDTKQIAEQEQVSDVTGTILKMGKIEGPCIDIGEEDKTVKHVEAMEDGDAEAEGKPKSIEKEIGGPKKYEEGETKIEESVELETSKEVSSFEPSSSQGKEPLSQTADPTINNLDNPETGEGMQEKRNTEDTATATHETQEKQTEEMNSQQVDKPDVCMVSETESEENVNRSPPGEAQNLILEKTAEAGSSEGENIKDEMNPEQNPDGLFVKHEENKQIMHQDLAMADESTEANENSTSDAVPITITTAQDHSVIADEDKIMDVVENIVPDHGKQEMSKYEDEIRETFVQQDEAVDENENSMALISREIDTATSTECYEEIASAKEETPIKIPGEDFEDKKEEKPIDTDAVVDSGPPIEKGLPPTDLNEKIEDAGLELQYKNSSELHISHSLEQETMPVQGEKKPEDSDFEAQEQDHEANGQSKDLEKHAEDASEARESMQNTDLENLSGEGAVTAEVNSKADEMAVEREEKVNELESEEKLAIDDAGTNFEEEMQKKEEAHDEQTYEMAVEREEKVNELESEEKLAIDDAGTNFEEEMQKKEEAHDEQTYEMATSDRIEEVTSDEVCSREFADQKVERGVQAAGFQEAEIPLKNGVEESYEMSSLVNEEITDVEDVIDEEKIKDEATHLSSELVFEEKIVESSQDKETEAEMSKGDDVEEQMMEDDNAKVILRESIQEASVNDCKNDGENAVKSGREMNEVSEAEKRNETNNNDEIPDSTLQDSLLKEQESLQTENLTAEAEEKDEDRSSIRKDEEDVEQISPKNAPGENLEPSASMVSAGTEDVALNKTTQKTEEEIDEGGEGIKKEAEIGKEDGEEQAIDENDDESIQVESIKEVPVSMVPNDENNAEEFEGEIFEESVKAGTNVSITDATYQNDGTPRAVLETSTVKQMEIVQGEEKDTAPAEYSPEEEEEHDRAGGLKRVEDNSSDIRLEGDLEKSDEETSRTIDAVSHEIDQHSEFPNSTLETSPVEEQASLQIESLTPAENSPEGKKNEDGSSNKKDEDKEKNTGLAEEKAEENLEQILQNNTVVENPKQPINMICAETEADASSKMVDNREEEIVEIPRGNAEAELLKEENIEGHVVEESNIHSLSRESAEESPIKDFQNSAKNYEKSTEEMLESQIAGGYETPTNDEDCNSSLTVSEDKIDESFKDEDKNITPAEVSPHDEKEELGSFDRADGNDNNPELIVTNQDSAREELKVEEDFEQELQRIEPGEPEEPSTIMVSEIEAGTPSDKIDDITSQEEAVIIHNIEETVEKEKEKEHGSLNKEGERYDSNPDLTVANQDSVREASEVQGDSKQELPIIELREPGESSAVMAVETEADTLSDKIDDIASHEEAVTIHNIEETMEKENEEEHRSSDKECEGDDSNPDLTVANQDGVREASEVQGDFEQELSRIESGEPEEPSTIMASETEADTLSDKIDDITSQEEAVTIHNIEEIVEKEKEEEHGSSNKEGEGNDSNPDLTVGTKDNVRESSEVQDDSEQELPRIEPGEPEESSTIMASETGACTLSDKIDDIIGQEEVVTIHNIEETVKREEHGSSDKEGKGNDSNPDLTVANQVSVREASEVQGDSEQELLIIEPGEPRESSAVMAADTEVDTLSGKIDDITSQEEVVTIHNIEEIVEKEKEEEHGSSNKEGEGNDSNPDLTVGTKDNVRESSEVQDDSEQELPRIEPGEPRESSAVMGAETEAGTLSDKIDDIASQEEAVTIHNIEETMEKENKEEHRSSDKEGEGDDSNPDLTVANQDGVREASEVQGDSEQELPRIESGEPEKPLTIMVSETEADTLSGKIDDIASQEEAVTIHNIEETVEKEKEEEHGSSNKEGKGNDSNPDLTVANQDSVREASEVQGDFEQELPIIELGEPGESSAVIAAETEADTLSDKIDDIASQEEVVTIHNIEETMEKENKEEHQSSDKEGEGNDSNPDLTVANQDCVREASEVQGDSEQELPRIESGEPEEPSTIMASETEVDTLSGKIDDITSQEEAVTIHNIEEIVEKEKEEEHGSSNKEGEGNDSNPDLIVGTKDSVREASEVQGDSEQELLIIEPGEPGESSTVMAAETEADTLSDKIDDIASQEEAVTIHNIEETMEKEKEEEHLSLDKEGEGDDSNPDLTVANQDSVRETSEVQGDSEQELPRIEPGEPEELLIIMASETEAGTLNDKIDDIAGQEEAVTIHNIDETMEKEKNTGSEDIDVTKVERAVEEEDLKLVAEASDVNKSVENDVDENIISGGKEVETAEKTFGLDSIQKLEVEEKREHKVEKTKDEDIKEVCEDTKLASLGVDTEKHVTTEEHTNTDISPHTTGETTAEEKVKTVNEMEESVITSVDEDVEKKVPEEENAINDRSRIIYNGDESRMLTEHEDIGKQGSVIKDNYEVPLSSTSEENPLQKETKDESDEAKPNNEVKDSKYEFTEPFEARGLVDRQEFETLRGIQVPSSDICLEKASGEVSEKESSKSLVEISCLESESKGEILEEVQSDVDDSSSTLTTGTTRETSFKEAEPEDKSQIESFEPAPQAKGPVTESTERTTRESMDIDAKAEDANFIENEDHGIPAANEAEELENEMHKETPKTGSEDYKEETTNETPLGSVFDDKLEECSAMLPQEPELVTNEGNNAADENPTTYENIETPQTPPQEIEIMLKEDMTINERDASKSVDPRKENMKEEDGSSQVDNLNEHHELDNEKQEGIHISKSSEVRGITNQGEICKLMSLEGEYSSNVGDEILKCIEATSAKRKDVILEEDNSTKKPEDSLTENVEANKAAFELEERTNNQEHAIGTEDYGVLPEENFEVSESGTKLEGVFETETGDQSSQNIPEAYSGTVENSTEIQNKSLKSIEQSSHESQEVREETGEKTELRFEPEGDVKETQNTDDTVKDVLLTEEVHEKVDGAGSETLKSTEKDVNDTRELCAKSTEDERVDEVKESSLIAGECHDSTESNEQTAVMSSDLQEAPTMEEMSLAKAINDEDNEMHAVLSTTTPAEDNEMTAVLSTTTPAEELDEMIKVIKEEDNCRDKIKATAMVEITETSLEEAQLDEKLVQVSNITSNDSVSLEIEDEACQEEKVKDNVGIELPSLNLASQIPIDDHKNIMREQEAKENSDANDVQEDERASGVVYESKDHGIEELVTSKIKEENEKSSEIGESPGAEAAANEAVIDQNPPEVISKEEKGISETEIREENMKDVEFREDDLRKTEDVFLQKDDDCEERDISQLELQPSKDIQNQSPNEVLEEECGTPDETNEEIKEGPKLVSMTNSQGFEALKEDESTSGHTVLEEKSEEQNQTSAVALLSKENDCGTEMIVENIEEYVHVELPADPQNYSPPKITEDTSELEVSGLGAELNTCIQKDSLNKVQVEESKSPDDASKLQIPEYETSKEASESTPEVHGLKGFTASEETEIKEKHLVAAITDLAEEENRGEKLIDSAEIMHDGVIEEGTLEGTSNLRTELSKEAVKSVSEVHGHEVLAESEDTEIKVKHPEVTATDMAAEQNHSERTIDTTEIIHDKLKSEEEMDVEISQKEGPSDLAEASEATRDIHEEEETSKTTTEHIQEHAKEVEIEVDELPSATMTAENTCSQKEETKEQEVCGSGVECNIDVQKNGSNEFDEEAGRTTDEDSTMEPKGYEKKIKDEEYLPESNKMTEITETGTFEKTFDLRAETSEETSKSVSEVHEHQVLAESKHAEIKKEKHTEVAVTDLVAGENQNKKTIDATEVVHDELTNEELAKQDKQQFKEEMEDTENSKPIKLGEETTKESHQIYDLKAEKSHEDKMENEIQNEEVSNESREYLHQTAVENETINESFPDEALVKNPEDMGTKLQVENHSDEKNSGYDRTEAITITNEELGAEISEKESLQDPAETIETTQDIHQGERDSDSTSEKPVPIEAETQETTERKKDAPQGLLQEPIVESTQGAEVGESEPGKATGIVDAQGFEHRTETSIDEKNVRGNDESMSANISLFDMMQSSTRELQVKGELTEEKEANETRVEGEKAKSDEEKEDEEEGEEHKTTDSPVMVESSRDTVDVKVASKKHHNILSGVGSKVKQSISKVKKAITGKSSHPKQHSPK